MKGDRVFACIKNWLYIIVLFFRYVRAFPPDWTPYTFDEARSIVKSKYLSTVVKLALERKLHPTDAIMIDLGLLPEDEKKRDQLIWKLEHPDQVEKIQRPFIANGNWPVDGRPAKNVEYVTNYEDAVKRPRGSSKAPYTKPDRDRTRKGLDFADPELRLKAQLDHAQQLVDVAKREYIGWSLNRFFEKLNQ